MVGNLYRNGHGLGPNSPCMGLPVPPVHQRPKPLNEQSLGGQLLSFTACFKLSSQFRSFHYGLQHYPSSVSSTYFTSCSKIHGVPLKYENLLKKKGRSETDFCFSATLSPGAIQQRQPDHIDQLDLHINERPVARLAVAFISAVGLVAARPIVVGRLRKAGPAPSGNPRMANLEPPALPAYLQQGTFTHLHYLQTPAD